MSETRQPVSERPLTEREREILMFLLTAPGVPDVDALREQVAVSTASQCECGCASIELTVDRTAARPARGLRRELVETLTEDIARVHELTPLRFYGDDGYIDPFHQVTPADLDGYIGLILWATRSGWLSGVEMHLVGNFARPSTFPPPEVFGAPTLCTGAEAW